MGVGFPVDLVICSLLGADMFDCVYPTRTARLEIADCRIDVMLIDLEQQWLEMAGFFGLIKNSLRPTSLQLMRIVPVTPVKLTRVHL